MATNTALDVGIRRNFATLGDRNFEPAGALAGTDQYSCLHDGLVFLGTAYHTGDTLPFDVGGVSYSAAAVGELELYWNQGYIAPLS